MRRWEWENDNGEPEATDYSRLNTADADRFTRAYLLPFKRAWSRPAASRPT